LHAKLHGNKIAATTKGKSPMTIEERITALEQHQLKMAELIEKISDILGQLLQSLQDIIGKLIGK